jgi:hypothetical protein
MMLERYRRLHACWAEPRGFASTQNRGLVQCVNEPQRYGNEALGVHRVVTLRSRRNPMIISKDSNDRASSAPPP